MPVLFAPAVALMKNLKYPYKFALIGLVAAVAVGFLLIGMLANLKGAIDLGEREIGGIRVIKPTLHLVRALQQHRMLTSGALTGLEELKTKAPAKAAEIDQAIAAVDAALAAHGKAFGVGGEWTGIKKEWSDLAGEWADLTPPANISAHNALIEHALQVNAAVNDVSGLVVDPALDSYYLVSTAVTTLPDLLERVGKLGAAGMSVLSRKLVTDDQRFGFTRDLGNLDKLKADVLTGLERSGKYNAAIKPKLDDFHQKFGARVGEIIYVVEYEIATGRLNSTPAYFFGKAADAIDSGYAELGATLFPTVETLIGDRIARNQALLALDLGIAVALLLAFAYLSIGFYLSIIDGVRHLSTGAQRIAAGDLTARVPIETKDELAQVGTGFNTMATELGSLIGKIQASAGNVTAAATRLAQSSAHIQESSQRQSESAAAMAASVEQTTVGIGQIADFAHEAQAISSESGALSEEGGEIVQNTVAEMKQIAETVRSSAGLIEELGHQSESISAIVNVIKDIADQTNLLALNAAIEAARAGDQGRGFAVVADEVRKLAERTTNSTKDISTMIAAIQDGTHQAVSSMQAGVDSVSQGVVLAQRAGEAMEKIKAGTARVVRSVNDISYALKEQSAASNEIARNVERIAQMADENSADVASSTATARELETLATVLQDEARHYRVR